MLPVFEQTDQALRSIAYDILCRRDRLSGWKPHRDVFLRSLTKDLNSLNRDVLVSLQKLIKHAYDSCPYYRGVLEEVGIRSSSSFCPEDIDLLPFLTKETIREKKSMMVSKRFGSSELDLSYTGGTTGTQTSFYLDHACRTARVGRQWGILKMCGYQPGMRRGLVWGVHEDLPAEGLHSSFKQRFRRYASSQETLCCTVMNNQMLMDYHGTLLRFRPEVLYGYPSALAQLGRFIEDRGLEPIRVTTIITTAERLSDANRRHLIRCYGGKVFNLYCTREHGCIGFECELHQGFHVDSGSIYMEIVKDGKRVRPGQPGEIVITDLLNYGMPFIRSRTGDIGMYSQRPCECGSPLPLLMELDGRSSDLLYRPDGSVVPGIMLTDLFMDLPAIRFTQFVQKRVEELDVLMVVTEAFSDLEQTEVVRQVRELMGDKITVRVKLVEEIPRNPRSGKLREIICTVDSLEFARENGFPSPHQ